MAGMLTVLSRAVPKLAMDTTDLDFKAAVEDSYANLKSARSAFRLSDIGDSTLPDDLVIELLTPSLQVLARAYVEG
jgi:dihydroxyacetone kinase DhaKLM complex PTS-EIIA-like component DhaM